MLGEKKSLRSDRSPMRRWNDSTEALGKDQEHDLVHREKQARSGVFCIKLVLQTLTLDKVHAGEG